MRKILLLCLLVVMLVAENVPVTLQLQWLHQFQFAGFYVAKEKGFYADAGLDVTFKEYNQSVSVIEEVTSQRADYGLGRSSLLINRSNGKEIVALGAIFQSSPSVLITTNPYLKKPQDLFGQRIMITPGEASSASILTMLLSNQVSQDDFILQKHSFNIHDLINGKTDAMACYLSNEPHYLDQHNIAYTIFNPKDYGFDFYGDILFTSEREIKEHPARVKAFYEASRKGWLWAF